MDLFNFWDSESDGMNYLMVINFRVCSDAGTYQGYDALGAGSQRGYNPQNVLNNHEEIPKFLNQ